MADIKHGLKFYVNAGATGIAAHVKQEDTASATGVGVMVFNEPTKQIFVHGVAYGLSNTESSQLSEIINTLSATGVGLLTNNDGVLSFNSDNTIQDQITGALGNALGNFEDVARPTGVEGDATIAEYIADLQTTIAEMQSSITELSGGAITSVNGITAPTGSSAIAITGTNIIVGGEGYGAATSIAGAINALSTSDNITVGGSGYGSETSVAAAINALSSSDNISYDGAATTVNAALDDLYGKYNDIGLDSFVKEGKLVYGAATGVQGTHTPTGYATLPVSVEGPTGDWVDPYIQLVIKDGDNDESYIMIAASDLVDVYTATSQTGPVEVKIEGHNITASLSITGAQADYTPTGAEAGENVSSTSVVNVVGGVTVETEDGSVSSVGGTSVLADAAGAAAAAKDEVIGNATGAQASDLTIYGAKAYADSLVDGTFDPTGAAIAALTGAMNYADGLATNYDPTGAAYTAEKNAKDYTDGVVSWEIIEDA